MDDFCEHVTLKCNIFLEYTEWNQTYGEHKQNEIWHLTEKTRNTKILTTGRIRRNEISENTYCSLGTKGLIHVKIQN